MLYVAIYLESDKGYIYDEDYLPMVSLLLMQDALYNVRFIIKTPAKTFCLENPTEDCYEQLSGDPIKYLKIYVEDDLASVIAQKVCTECGVRTHAHIIRFGSITNSVRLALGLACQHDNLADLDDLVFFGDGDVSEFTNEAGIREQINRTLTGGEEYLQQKRDKVLGMIKHFSPIKADGTIVHPEEYIHEALIELDETTNSYPEVITKSKSILAVVNQHEYVNKLLEQGIPLTDVISAFAKSDKWEPYVENLKHWINLRKDVHIANIDNV